MIFEVAHQLGLIPIAAMVIAGRRLPTPYWLVAGAFAMSWLGDSVAHAAGGPWDAVYWWLLPQFVLAVAAVTTDRVQLRWMSAMAIVGAASLMLTPYPDWLLTLAGSAAVLMLARGPLTVPLAVYFGAGSGAYFWMLAAVNTGGNVLPAWYVYQGCRVAAYGAFVGLILLHWTGAINGMDDRSAAGPADRAGPSAGGQALARPAGRHARQHTVEG